MSAIKRMGIVITESYNAIDTLPKSLNTEQKTALAILSCAGAHDKIATCFFVEMKAMGRASMMT
jgi:hypothetical protein